MQKDLTAPPGPLVAQPAKITIEQDKNGQFRLTHNVIKPLYLIGILSDTLHGVIGQFIQQEQMVIDPNKPRIVPGAPTDPQPPTDKVS